MVCPITVTELIGPVFRIVSTERDTKEEEMHRREICV